jgi:predicted Fe-Mo cluster-binding NifX family protein
VASETGQNIDACFGRVDKFLIYQLIQSENGPTYEFVEERAGPCPCQDKKHDQALLSQRADLLSDCGLVLAGRIGPAASQALSERGLLALSAHLPIKEALKKLAQK